ncbi:MAG: hypothetical protein OEW65_11780, partial [Thermoleophilia bacterium]|nr:hypothetical protein [Thermoleophilia bacterium]
MVALALKLRCVSGYAVELRHGVVLDPDGWAARFGSALRDARCARDESLRALARESGGRFTARDLRRYERGLRPVGDRLSPLLADLYEVELGEIARPDMSLEVDLDAQVVRAGGATRAFTPEGDVAHSALAAYLDLVRAMRGTGRTNVSLRRGDVEVLGAVLALDEERVAERLAELMQVSRNDARRLLLQLRQRPLVVPATVAALVGVTAGLALVSGNVERTQPGSRTAASPAAPFVIAHTPSAAISPAGDAVMLALRPPSDGASTAPGGAPPAVGPDTGFSSGPGGQHQPGPPPNGFASSDGTSDDAAAGPVTEPAGAGWGGDRADWAPDGTGTAGSGEAAGAVDAPAGTTETGSSAGGGSGPAGPPVGDPPVDDPPVADPPVSDPPVADPPAGDSPVADPPVSDPPVGDPPVDDPSASDPPVGDPPADDPAASDPPVGDPPVSDPPVGDPPADDPAASDPPVSEPPVSDPPVSDPPVSDPPVSDPHS